MRLLLDTHVALWWVNEPATLDKKAREAITDSANEVFLSAVSVWEAAVKEATGRLSMPTSLTEAAREAGLLELRIAWNHGERAAFLPPLHRDPFDRMLVAQALEEGLVLATRDPLVQQYAVATLSA